MKLIHPLLAIGVLLVEALLIWWAITQIDPIEAIAEDNPAATVAEAPVVGRRWVVWYGKDDQVHRQQVDADAYLELQHSLREVREKDLQRLIALAADYLRIDLQPVFADLTARREPFLISFFDFGTSSALLGTALTAAEKVYLLEDQEAALSQVREATTQEAVNRFRSQLIAPETTLRGLREAAGRSLSLLRQDLLQDCDRYDRAFRTLVLSSTATMETLDAEAGWQVDIAFRPETATFRSLCAGLHHIDLGIYVVEAALTESFAKVEPVMYKEAWELVLPIAKTALEMTKYIDESTVSFADWAGIPKDWAHPPASVVSYISHTRILARRVGERLDVRRKRPRLRLTIQKSLDELQGDLMDRLQRTCNEFITAELSRIELGLAARGEGFWSTP